MQKKSQKFPDFFSEYRLTRIRKYLFSTSIAVFVAFATVSVIHSDIDPRGLMADVAGVTSSTQYDADVIMTRPTSNHVSLVFGARATLVDSIELTLLGDPSRLRSITSTDPDIRIISQSDMGVYRISLDIQGRDILAGTQIALLTIDIDTGAPLALSDTEFVSEGVRYSLSNKGE